MNVHLKVKDNGPYIYPPDFCPFKTRDLGESFTVHSSICKICKLCDFTITPIVDKEELSGEELKQVINYLQRENTRIVKSILAQLNHLKTKDRSPLAIFISAGTFEHTLLHCGISNIRCQNLLNYYAGTHKQLGVIFGLPSFIFGKLTNSPVMVVGEVFWK